MMTSSLSRSSWRIWLNATPTYGTGLMENMPDLALAANLTTPHVFPVSGRLNTSGNDGTVTKFALWDPKAEGVLAANLAADLVDGTVAPSANASFSVPCLGDYTITSGTEIITGPPQVFDASNIDQFNF